MEFDSHFFIEAFGYLASLTVVFSLTRTSVRKLWIINSFGAFGFIVYAMITASYPTALMNLGALVIDIVQLYRLRHVHESFETVDATPGSAYYNWFINRNAEDIKAYDREERYKSAEHTIFFVRSNEVAGILAYNIKDNKAEIVLDYVTERFRDCKIGRYFFGSANPYFTKLGVTELVTRTDNPKHKSYLESLHFKAAANGLWTKDICEPHVAMI